jgi:hypothetical protein
MKHLVHSLTPIYHMEKIEMKKFHHELLPDKSISSSSLRGRKDQNDIEDYLESLYHELTTLTPYQELLNGN